MRITGPDFVALQVSDLERAAAFYDHTLGLTRARIEQPGAIVYATEPIQLAVRTPLPGVDPEGAKPHPGVGVALWLLVDDASAAHAELVEAGVEVLGEPKPSPFGQTFAFRDPDGYVITLHDQA